MVRRITLPFIAGLLLRAGEMLVEAASYDGHPVPGRLRYRMLRYGRYLCQLVTSGAIDGKPQ